MGDGIRLRSASAYPRAMYKRKPVSVAVISKRRKSGGVSCLLARFQDLARDSSSRPGGVYKKRSNLRSVHTRIEQLILPVRSAVAAVECFPLAPAAAADEHPFPEVPDRLGDEIGFVGNQARVDALRSLERTFDLLARIEPIS